MKVLAEMLACGIIILSFQAAGQDVIPESLIDRLADDAGTADDAISVDESLVPDLESLRRHPLDLNRATAGEMVMTGLITAQQAEAILSHIGRYGRLLAVEELQATGAVTDGQIMEWRPFVVVTDPEEITANSPGDIIRNGNSEFFLRSYSVLEKSNGYRGVSRTYPGLPSSSLVRFRFNSRNRMIAGFILENDPGEFDPGGNRFADFVSWHLFIKSDGLVNRIAIGDYTVGYGQGLTYAGAGRSGLSFDAGQVIRPQSGIRPYRSVTESGFMRGAAAAFRKGRFGVDVFYSDMKEDATLTVYENGAITFRNLNTSGLHRTGSELEKRNSVAVRSIGSHIGYSGGSWQIGVTTVRIRYSRSREKHDRIYGLYDQSGRGSLRSGFSYSGRVRNVHLFGEVRYNDRKQKPFIAGAMMQLHSKLLWTVLLRSYPAGMDDLMTDPVSMAGGANETGIFNALNFHFSRSLSLNMFGDLYRRPWLSYSDDLPGHGTSGGIRIIYRPDRSREFLVQYRAVVSTENHSAEMDKLRQQGLRYRRSLRMQFRNAIGGGVTLRTRAEVSRVTKNSGRSFGFMMYQDIIYKPLMSRYSLNLRFVMFDTDDYSTRIYAYENNVLYAYSIPSYYYRGYRYYLLVSFKLHKKVTAWARFSQTVYIDRNEIGSGNDLIEGNTRSAIDLQLRYRF